MEKIMQIIPASGWVAVYEDDNEDTLIDPVVCFALVETGMGDRTVVPYVAGEKGSDIHNADTNEKYSHVMFLGAKQLAQIMTEDEDEYEE